MAYPLVNFHFQVEWGGTRIGFTEVTGLSAKQEIVEYRDGASKEYTTQKIPGLRKYSTIVLKRGVFKEDNELFEWFNTVKLGNLERRDITISLLNEEHEPTITWKIKDAWPVAINYAELNAMKSEVFIERVEIAHEGLNVQN